MIVAHGVVSRVIRGMHAGMDQAEMLAGATPQDGFYALMPGGRVRFVAC